MIVDAWDLRPGDRLVTGERVLSIAVHSWAGGTFAAGSVVHVRVAAGHGEQECTFAPSDGVNIETRGRR